MPRACTESEVVVRHHGLPDPLDWAEDCDLQFRKIDVFWEKLVEINRLFFDFYRSATADDPAVAEIVRNI